MQRLPRAITMSTSLRMVGIAVALVSVLLAVYLQISQGRVAPALRYACDLSAFAPVAGDCLEEVAVPVNRQYTVVTDRKAVEGQWTVHPVGKGELVHPSQLTAEPPDRFRFTASGEPLPEGVWGYYFLLPKAVLAAVSAGAELSLAVTDPLTRQMVIVLDKAEILDKGTDGVFLGLKMEQVAAIQRLLEDAQAKLPEGTPAPALVWTITQGKNPDLQPLAVFQMELESLRGGGD